MSDHMISRKDAAAFINEVLKFVHNLEEGQVVRNDPKQLQLSIGNRLRTIASSYGLPIPVGCTGQQHTDKENGAFIDNCMLCNNSGVVGPKVKVR